MLIKSFLAILLIVSKSCFATCLRNESIKINPFELPNIKLEAEACFLTEGNGYVLIDVKKDGLKIQSLKTSFESPAFVLSFDTKFDIDLDGTPDLAVGTGKGRDGNGMHYWRFNKTTYRYSDLGEAPELKHSIGYEKSNLFALITSSGEFQAIRYNYFVEKNKLVVLSALGFIPGNNPDFYQIVKLSAKGKYLNSDKSKKIFIKTSAAEKCMNGSGMCP